MVYTLQHGARNYNSRLHYSLYGGVEYAPDRSLAVKELLPLVAIPTVAIALLVAIINFHIPAISPQQGSSNGASAASGAAKGTTSALVLSPGGTATATTSSRTSPAAASTSSSRPAASAASSTSPAASSAPAAPVVKDTVNGITGGMGGDEETGSGSTTTPAAPAPAPIPTTGGILDASVGIDGTTVQVDAGVHAPIVDKQLISTSTTLDP